MQNYREQVDFDYDSGELSTNGRPMMPFNKEYWLPEGDAGSPQIETIGGDGPDLSDTDSLNYFKENLRRVSKIPMNRFDVENPPSWELNAEGMTRDEIKFGRFINRLRSVFQEIVVKPLWIQMTLDYPDLMNDDSFKAQVGVKFNKYNIFEEMKEMELLQKRIDFVTAMKDGLVDYDPDGNEIKYFSSEWLIRRFMDMSEAEIKANQRMKDKEQEKLDAMAEEEE